MKSFESYTQKAETRKQNTQPAGRLFELLSPNSNHDIDSVKVVMAELVVTLQEKKQNPELVVPLTKLISQLQQVYRGTLLALRLEFQRQNPGSSYREHHNFNPFFSKNFSIFFQNEVSKVVDLTELVPILGVEKLSPLEKKAHFVFPWKVAVFLFLISFLLGEYGNVQAQDEVPALEIGELEQNEARDMIAIGFELGQAQNPFLLWPLLSSDESRDENANIFEDLLVQSYNSRGNPIVVTGPIFERFDISQQQALELLTGYTLGFWNPDASVQPYLDTLSVVILTDSQAFIDICGTAAGACFRDQPEMTVYFPNDIAQAMDAPHEAAHGLTMGSEVWQSAFPIEIGTRNGSITPEIIRNYQGGVLGIGLQDQEGRIGIVDLLYVKEALAELLSTAQASSLGLVESEIYAMDDILLTVPDAYRYLTTRLGADAEVRAQFVDSLRNGSVFDTMELTGKIIHEQYPEYTTQVWEYLNSYPELEKNYYFNFNISRYDSAQVISELPDDLQAGLLLWGELASLVRVYGVTHPNAFTDEDETVAITYTMAGEPVFVFEKLDTIFNFEIRPSENDERFIRPEYFWGQTSAEVGAEQVVAWATEYQQTGTVQVADATERFQVVSALLEYQIQQKFGYELPYYREILLADALRSIDIQFGDRDQQALPYAVTRQDDQRWYAGVRVRDVEIATQVTTDEDTWVRDSLWAVLRTTFEYQLNLDTYIALPTYDTSRLIADFFDPSGVALLEKYAVTEDGVSVVVTDVSQLRDLSALLILHSLEGRGSDDYAHLDPVLQRFVESLDSNDTLNVFWSDTGVSNYYSLMDIGQTQFHGQGNTMDLTLAHLESISRSEQLPWLDIHQVAIAPSWSSSDAASSEYARDLLLGLRFLSTNSTYASWEIFYQTGAIDSIISQYPETNHERG